MAINDTIAGKAKELKGKVQEQYGKVTNDPEHVVKGNAEQVSGKATTAFGEFKDEAKEAVINTVEKVKNAFSSDDKKADEIPSTERPAPSVVDPQARY